MVILVGRPLGALLFGLGRIFPFVADVFSFAVSVGTSYGSGTGEAPGGLNARRAGTSDTRSAKGFNGFARIHLQASGCR